MSLRLIIIGILVFAFIGCGKPPVKKPIVQPKPIPLVDPYEQDIPPAALQQLREASLVADWAVPYIFIQIGQHFDLQDDEKRTLHFFTRAEEEFGKRNIITGQGLAAAYRVATLLRLGKEKEALGELEKMDSRWRAAPLSFFVDFNRGQYQLHQGNFAQAALHLRQVWTQNKTFRKDANLTILRRDTALALAGAIILPPYLERLGKRNALPETGEIFKVRAPIGEGMELLREGLILTREFAGTDTGKLFLPAHHEFYQSQLLLLLGLGNLVQGEGAEARQNLTQSLALARKGNFLRVQIESLFHLNQVLFSQAEAGLVSAEELKQLADKYQLVFYQIWSRYILARHLREMGQTDKARSALDEAIRLAEGRRDNLLSDPLRGINNLQRQLLYEDQLELLSLGTNHEAALELAERWKAAEMTAHLLGRDIGKNPKESALLQEEEQLQKAKDRQMFRLVNLFHPREAARALGQLSEMEEKYQGLLGEMRKTGLYPLIDLRGPSVKGIQELLDVDTTLFSYLVTERQLHVWALTKERVFGMRINISRGDLQSLVMGFLDAIAKKERRRVEFLSRRIYDTILKPIIPYVSGDRLGFIPHDCLTMLPFAALSYQGRYLNDGFSIFHLPFLGLFPQVMGRKPLRDGKIALFANPELGRKDAEATLSAGELEAIKKRFPALVLWQREKATKEWTKEALTQNETIHFSLPYSSSGDSPLDSYIQFTPQEKDDGRLSALEIYKLSFSGRLVIITGRNLTPSPGARPTILAEAFLQAGSPTAILAWWNPEEPGRTAFIDSLYKHLRRGREPADCLREAQQEMVRRGYPPSLWASLILVGRY